MKTKVLALTLSLLFTITLTAQTEKQRDEIKKEINQVELKKLQGQ